MIGSKTGYQSQIERRLLNGLDEERRLKKSIRVC